MVVRLSNPGDSSKILDAYLSSTRSMIDSGVDQWSFNYPNIHNIEKDIQSGISYVIEYSGKVGVIVLDEKEDDQYHKLKWPYESQKPLIIHRLAVHSELQGKGIGKRLCVFAEEVALKSGCDSIRLDAYSTNQASNKLYLGLGYKKAAGYCYFHHNKFPFVCYEKRIQNVSKSS